MQKNSPEGDQGGATSFFHRFVLPPVRSSFRVSSWTHLLALSCLAVPLTASAKLQAQRPLRVVVSDAFPPISFVDPQGRIQGLARDRWDLWQRRTGIPVELQAMDWLEAQKAVQAGRADVIAAMARTRDREKIYAFTQPYLEVDVRLYYDRRLSGIVDLDTSKAFKVGVRAGDVCIEKLKAAGNRTFRIYPDYSALIEASSSGSLPVFCMNELPANYILAREGLSEEFLQSPPIYTSAMYEAVRKDHTALRDTVIAGFNRISAAEEAAMERKWLGDGVHPRFSWLARHGLQVLGATAAAAGLIALWSASLKLEVRRRTRDLAEARDVLTSTIEAIPDPLIEISADGQILDVHSSRHNLLTRPAEEQVNHSLSEVLPESAAAVVKEALAEAGSRGFSHGKEIQLPLPSGPAWFELSVSQRSLPSQGQPRFLVLSRDITARKQDARRIERLNRLYTALSRSNQAMARLEDGTALLQEICEIAVTYGEMKMAWAGLLNPVGRELRAVAWAGTGTEYLDDLHISIDPDVPHGQGPLGRAMRENRPQWCQDFLNDASLAPWHDRARLYGWGSAAALPLLREGVVVGGLAIYHPDCNAFDEQSQQLLVEMVRDIDLTLSRLNALAMRRRLEQEMAASEAKYRELTESVHDVIWTLDPVTMRYLYVSPSVKRMRGYTPDEVIARPFADSLQPGSGQRMEEQIRSELEEFRQGLRSSEIVSVDEVEQPCKDGSSVWTEVVTKLIRNISTGRIEMHGVSRDITERRFANEQIKRLAYSDQLTGLANRVMLRDRFRHALMLAQKQGGRLALLNLNLDHFQTVNDSLGHAVGDQLLVEVARRLEGELRPGDTLSRTGGDEFLLLLPDTDADGALELVRRLLKTVASPCRVHGETLFTTASIGIALYPEDGSTMATLMSHADAAMHQVKEGSRNGFQFFTPSVQERISRHLRLSNALHKALKGNEFKLLYQPQMELVTNRIIGAEALLRWDSAELGSVSPGEFIAVAEANGLVIPIGDWVLRQALRDAGTWVRPAGQDGAPPLTVSVNISAVQFRNSDLAGRILTILAEEQLPPARLELELTESVTLDDPEKALLLMDRLYHEGIQIAIDDFGTGYSSLSYLKRIRAHKLKIDQSFVRGLATDRDDHAIVLTIINLARTLGLRTIAEGVETPEQMELLRRAGCDEIQGYWIGRPMSSEAFRQLPL
ncbi:bifunctional diguanylate cyclase/phosphodiesterase [Aphanothece cf. minutissima CCALA 015]|uniref:Bifunctional diguanylate cyclase/phosphodiesterase n=1 Tax=Aphanothece cf. minutissima CCALA 015 TaxID=2107695 RepID=A0ABX5F4C4_9CHRO|nr:bifunctional diguanylate cyclase/phosphodiesterase [Aphanothece cf. minutissima CCALA 015]